MGNYGMVKLLNGLKVAQELVEKGQADENIGVGY